MATKNAKPPALIELFDPSELTVEEGYNVRDKKQFDANKKELIGLIEASGGIDASIHTVQFVERTITVDGKKKTVKFIRGGHTLHAAATDLKMKVPAVKTEMTRLQELTNLVTSNAGHPLTQIEQGRVYKRMRNGDDPAKMEVGQEPLAAMSTKEIADSLKFTTTHIENCLAMEEASPEIRELLEAGKLSANAFVAAKQNVKAEGTVLKIVHAAIRKAKEEGKDTATPKHVKAVKEQFQPAKKKVAVSTTATTPAPGASTPSGDTTAGSTPGATPAATTEAGGASTEPKPADNGVAGLGKAGDAAPATTEAGGKAPEPAPAPAPQTEKLPMKTDNKKMKKKLIAVIGQWATDTTNAPSDAEIEDLAERVMTAQTEEAAPF